ncbi:MAG: short chain fatty acid transporter [Candidatus Acidoferrum typicum]|nr:short chain fatty acid transporter [Candidatus Acidoferrum typicum]
MPVPVKNAEHEREGESAVGFARLGMALADWSQRWFPDAFVFALAGLIVVFVTGALLGIAMRDLVKYFGEGFWSLIPFTMQMAMIIIGGYVVATSPPVHRLIRRLAGAPRTPRAAVAFVAFFSMATAMVSWGLSLIFSGVLVREVVRNVRGVDYRAIGAAAYLGTGSVWALGLSSSAALVMATPSAIPVALLKISGVIPLKETIYSWQSLTTAAILIFAGVIVAYLSAPVSSTKTAESFGVTEGLEVQKLEERRAPAEWLEYAPVLSLVVGLLGMAYLAQVLAARGPLAALDLNTYNLLFLMLGLLLHWRPRSFVRAVNNAVPSTAGVLIQFPFYGGIFGIITMSPLSRDLAHFFVSFSSTGTYPILVSIYSAILGMFVPSGGSKWIIEAPYVLQAAKDLRVNLGWVVQIYNTSEALPNLINPFWMLPLLGLLKVRARDLIGYGLVYFFVNSVLVLFFMWFFARTLPYVPPAIP